MENGAPVLHTLAHPAHSLRPLRRVVETHFTSGGYYRCVVS